MRKTNLLYVITKLELGGAQTHLLSLIRNLDPSAYNVFLFTARDGILMEDALMIPGLAVHRSVFLERSINPVLDLCACVELFRFIRRHKIRIVHTHSSKAGIIGRFASWCAGVKKIYHTVHGWSFNDIQSVWARLPCVWLERLAGLCTTVIIVVSEHDMRRGLDAGIASHKTYSLIRYGIDIKQFESGRPVLRRELQLPERAFLVGMIACFKPQKAVIDFIRVAAQLRAAGADAFFVVVGDGQGRREIEDAVRSCRIGDRVRLPGWRRDIEDVLSSFDVFVLTSLWEGMPIAVIEAMASSKPVIVTDTGGVREIVTDNENGYIVRRGDTRAMAERLGRLLQNKSLAREMGKKARCSLSEDYTIREMAGRTSGLYERGP